MNNKDQYCKFCETTYVPIFSKPWWMDAICLPEYWDVWLYGNSGDTIAALPYYMEYRNGLKYVTKAPLTQNNGLIIRFPDEQKSASRNKFIEHVVNDADEFIKSLALDVYEQQFHYSFDNWLPFYWHNYSATTRYTCVIEDTTDMKKIWDDFVPNLRKNIRKAEKLTKVYWGLDPLIFYSEHEKIYSKQNLSVPFSLESWEKLYQACLENNAGETLYCLDEESNITSLMFIVWDEKSVYPLIGGPIPDYFSTESYCLLTFESIKYASEHGLSYDFEGSVIKRIFNSFNQYGPCMKPYFRIRKVFNADVIQAEADVAKNLL